MEVSSSVTNFEKLSGTHSHSVLRAVDHSDIPQCQGTISAPEEGQSSQEVSKVSLLLERTADDGSAPVGESSLENEKMTPSDTQSSLAMEHLLPGKDNETFEDWDLTIAAVEREITRSRCREFDGTDDDLSVILDRVRLTTNAQEYLFKKYGNNIGRLSLWYDGLTWLSTGINACESLRYLNLGGNDFQNFPLVILELAELQTLDLSDNKLVKIPDSISTLEKLMILDVKYNELQALPRTLQDMMCLELICIHFNPFSDRSLKRLGLRIHELFPAITRPSFGLYSEVINDGAYERMRDLTSAVKRYLRNSKLDSNVSNRPGATARTERRHMSSTKTALDRLSSENLDKLVSEKGTQDTNRELYSRVQGVLVDSGYWSDVSSDAADIVSLLEHFSISSIGTSGGSMSGCNASSTVGASAGEPPASSEPQTSSLFISSIGDSFSDRIPQGPHRKLLGSLMAQSHDIKLTRDEAESVDALGHGALHIASKFGACTDQLMKIMDEVSDINHISLKGETFLHLLTTLTHCGCGTVNIRHVLKRARQRGFRFDLQDFEGYNALSKIYSESRRSASCAELPLYLLDCLKELEAEHCCRTLTQRNCEGTNLIDLFESSNLFPCEFQGLLDSIYQKLVLEKKFSLVNALEDTIPSMHLDNQPTTRHTSSGNALHQVCEVFGTPSTRICYSHHGPECTFLDLGNKFGDFASGLETLLRFGFDANDYNEAGITPLMVLIARGSALEIDLGPTAHDEAKGNKGDKRRRIETEYVRCIEIFIKNGARMYQFDRSGNTVLLQAIWQGFQLGLCVLIELGANVNVRNKQTTRSALEIAQTFHRRCNYPHGKYELYHWRLRDVSGGIMCPPKEQDIAYAHSLWILTLLVDLGAVADPSLEQELGLGLHDPALHRRPRNRSIKETGNVNVEDIEDRHSAISSWWPAI